MVRKTKLEGGEGGLTQNLPAGHPTTCLRFLSKSGWFHNSICTGSWTFWKNRQEVNSPNKPNGNKVMNDQFRKVLPRLLQPQNKYKELLYPIGQLHQVISLKQWSHLPVRIFWYFDERTESNSRHITSTPSQKCSVRYHHIGSWDITNYAGLGNCTKNGGR